MAFTVEEVKDNAMYNLNNAVFPFQIELGKQQMKNYEIAKQLGADDDDDWSEWEEKVENYKKENK